MPGGVSNRGSVSSKKESTWGPESEWEGIFVQVLKGKKNARKSRRPPEERAHQSYMREQRKRPPTAIRRKKK